MATKSNMKGFFKQQKKGIAKSKAKSKSSCSTPMISAGVDAPQPPALVSHGSHDLQVDYEENDNVLRQFDMNLVYGPCLGISRLARWERAKKFGLNPPNDLLSILEGKNTGKECLWDGLV
ncbi:unnamed protein product [Cuscuta campestris]|uniref:DNA polymerase delta subunit 4 n=1 Tax=Cuscuta campestris TaxID=132261 RepID=A0A484KH76_9ASTE|nr:unnamed protein product [Cuscuta campestris]